MRLVQIDKNVLINPEHVAHIIVRNAPAPENGGPFAHEYPVYDITMYDGASYEIPIMSDYPNEYNPFVPIGYLLTELTQGH